MGGDFFIRRWSAEDNGFARSLARLRRPPDLENVRAAVADILRQVESEGDDAVLRLTARLDGVRKKTAAELFVPPAALRAACKKIPKPLLKALRDAAGRIGDYHRRQIPKSWRRKDAFGNIVGERMTAMARAAVYAPGGRAAYPSSALMGLIPAKIAGVGEVFLFSPPAKGGLPPLILAAAAVGGADGVWTIGGAQALAAAAFGTETIPRADVAVGPGNAYVAEAKRQLAGRVGVDSLAGPSELLIVGDRATNAEWAAADMLAQAEHDEHAQSIAVSPSAEFLDKLEKALAKQLAGQPREKIIRHSLSERGALIWAKDMDACCQIADEIAAEHLQVMCANAAKVASRIRNAGGIFIGAFSSAALGDYGAGPNHVLPTAGTARFASPLSAAHFMKRSGILQASSSGASPLAKTAAVLADAEGLPAHARAAKLREKS